MAARTVDSNQPVRAKNDLLEKNYLILTTQIRISSLKNRVSDKQILTVPFFSPQTDDLEKSPKVAPKETLLAIKQK